MKTTATLVSADWDKASILVAGASGLTPKVPSIPAHPRDSAPSTATTETARKCELEREAQGEATSGEA